MAVKETEELEKLLREYLSTNSILIVDSVNAARLNLATALGKFGATRQKMTLVGSVPEAKIEIEKTKPKVIFADFTVGSDSGLDLLQSYRAGNAQENLRDSMFILVTSNASQAAVARASEEDVDTYILKPYTLEILKSALLQTVQNKLLPNLYLRLIEEGKSKLAKSQYEEAIVSFEKATHENTQPALACYYYGQTEFLREEILVAEKKFKKGLSFNSIHYKCLFGLFDLLSLQKKHVEAYEVMRTICQYFPANPKRMAAVLRLAIITENFQDMEGYYSIFTKIAERSDELVKVMCSALVVTGKYYLRTQFPTRALEVFEKAAISAAGKSAFLLYIIETLVDFKMIADADRFLSRLNELSPNNLDFQAAKFLVSALDQDIKRAIKVGREAVKAGVEIPSVHEKLITLSILAGYQTAAEELFRYAVKRWPDREGAFNLAMVSDKINKSVSL